MRKKMEKIWLNRLYWQASMSFVPWILLLEPHCAPCTHIAVYLWYVDQMLEQFSQKVQWTLGSWIIPHVFRENKLCSEWPHLLASKCEVFLSGHSKDRKEHFFQNDPNSMNMNISKNRIKLFRVFFNETFHLIDTMTYDTLNRNITEDWMTQNEK